jgi:YTV
MSRRFLAMAASAIAITLIIGVAGESTSRAATTGPETGSSKFKHARFENESRRFEPKYGFRPIEVAPPCPVPCVEKRTVMVPEYVIEHKQVPTTEIRHEERDREIVTYKDVPEVIHRTRTITVMEQVLRPREEKYTVQRTITEKVAQPYTVCVPYTVTRTATRTVLKPVWKDVECKYTVCVPYCEKRTGMRTVSKCVPVIRTRDFCVDEGCWQERVTAPVCQTPACKPCVPCGPVVTVAVCKSRVWVPKLVHKHESYTVSTVQTVHVPYEYEVKLERPEVRTRIEKVRTLVPTAEPYSYDVQLTRTETRTRFIEVCKFVPELRTRIINETVLVPRQKTQTYCETVCHRVTEKRIVKERIDVPVCVTREVEVRVCRLVPKTVEVQVAMKPVCVSWLGRK